ncbi:5-bromo-4-chloroindolyl phosphate hydrolysis family protein [Granulicatella seriolae]|uniref:5-bromo-4-chloroindolyl phosphate hydrolysis family protein n=1 Tax=Granulicatella seriolae TaxID=2967226 RepID=A0ABT1WPE0_9LACT|nr:5-bromo-4-chloroindolyl phosphate hydrolysis family protein [Granulicatella seriolae]
MKPKSSKILRFIIFVILTFLLFLYFDNNMIYRSNDIVDIAAFFLVFYGLFRLFFPKRSKGQESTRNRRRKKSQRSAEDDMPVLTDEKIEFYSQQGLTQEETFFFRTQLYKAKQHIDHIEVNIKKSTKLEAIEQRYGLLSLVKTYFKDISKEPLRLSQVDGFLYTYLPSLDELTAKYLEINNHATKTQLTYQTLDRTVQTIESICVKIEEDYLQFQKNDFTDANIEMEHVERKMNQTEKPVFEEDDFLFEDY